MVRTSYDLEYGQASVELQREGVQKRGARIAIVDDLLATGGTLKAACQLINLLEIEAEVVECFVIMELGFLAGRNAVPAKIESMLTF